MIRNSQHAVQNPPRIGKNAAPPSSPACCSHGSPRYTQGAKMVSRLPKRRHQACHLTVLGTENNCTRFENHKCLKKRGLVTNIQKAASQHTPRHLEKQKPNFDKPTSQQANSQWDGGMGEAWKYNRKGWYWMVLDSIRWYWMVVDCIGCHWMVLNDIGWYRMVLDGIGKIPKMKNKGVGNE